MPSELRDAFARGRAEGRALVMPFFVCGYPDDETFLESVRAAGEAGADVLELGIPFSDPIMDGPVIQEAANRVLERHVHTAGMIELIGKAKAASGCAVVAMTYYNIVFHYGLDAFASDLAAAGAAGAILPDLVVEDAGAWRAACARAGLAPVFIAAQTSPPDRLRALGEAGDGFVYAASLLGVTGERAELNAGARALVERIRAATDLPVAVGIGVSTPEHARDVAAYADGVIVGSALVRLVGEAADAPEAVRAFVGSLRDAVAR
ncbi:MAG TPA: tryptophan synthase subunit alpha [Actinomycetota bacterium]